MFFNPLQTSTIPDLISFGKSLDLSHAKLHTRSSFFAEDDARIIINYTSILDKYYELIKKNTTIIEMNENEFDKYRFQPKRFCMDFYNTPELWSLLLRINNITSATQFDMKKIKVFTSDIFDVLNEILILEENAIRQNTEDVYKK